MATLLHDLRYAVRLLRRSPGFSLIAAATLALGIGATTGVFSLVDGVLLRPLPYDHPDRIVAVTRTRPQGSGESFSAPDFLDVRSDSRTLEQMAALRDDMFTLAVHGVPTQIAGARVSAAFFAVFGARPTAGRLFGRADDKSGASLVVLGEGVWRQEFGGDATIVGRTIRLDRHPYTVVGIAPASFAWPADARLWVLAPRGVPEPPLALTGDFLANRGLQYLDVVGRLRPDTSLPQAQAELDTIAARVAAANPADAAGKGVHLVRLRQQLVGEVRPALLVLLGAVTILLLIACINVANLLLARATARQREIGIRTALGASRGRILRQLLTESVTLALLGGAAGLLLAWALTRLLPWLAPDSLPRLGDVRLDWRVAAFAALVSSMTGVLFGLVPAWQVSASRPDAALRAGDTRTGSGTGGAGGAMIVAQVALSLMLLITAGLVGRSLLRMLQEDPGFDVSHVVSAQVFLPQTQYRTLQAQTAFYDRVLGRLRAAPGAERAAIVFSLPLASVGRGRLSIAIQGRPDPGPGQRPTIGLNIVSPAYFQVMGIPLRRGRLLTDADRDEPPRAILVNEAMSRRFWPDGDPIGARVDLGMGDTDAPQWSTVVGVVGGVRGTSLDTAPQPEAYLPYHAFLLPFMTAVVRTDGTAAADATAVGAIRAAVGEIDPNLPLGDVHTMSEIVSRSVRAPRLRAVVLGAFALLALVLAAIGIYGLVSYSVEARTRELGIRVALGAGRGDIRSLVVGRGVRLLAAGAALGIGGAWAIGRVIAGMLYGVTPVDPLTYGVLSALMIATGVAASYVPARRAMRVDPMVALRSE